MGAIPFSGPRLEPDSLTAPHPAAAPVGFPADSGGCVVALTDTTPDGSNAVWRAAGLARDLGLPLRVLLAAGRESDLPAARELAERLARQAVQRLGVTAAGHAAAGDMRRLAAGLAPRPALLVLPYQRGNAVADWLLGAQAERIFRSVFTPTLVVRRPASSSYRRVMVAAKLEESAMLLIGAARSISRDPRISVVHVMSTDEELRLRIADAPEHALKARRLRGSTAAWKELSRWVDASGAGDSATAQVVTGHAPARVQEIVRASRAQLAIVGKRKASLLGDMLADGVGRRLVNAGSADVLMLPLHRDARRGQSRNSFDLYSSA